MIASINFPMRKGRETFQVVIFAFDGRMGWEFIIKRFDDVQKANESDLNIKIEYFRTLPMNSKDSNLDIQSFPSFLSSSFVFDDVSIKNQISFKLSNEDELANIAFGSFTDIKSDASDRVPTRLPEMELKRCTSFQEMLMENHRTVLIDSIRQYFEKTKHTFLKSFKNMREFTSKVNLDEERKASQQTQQNIYKIFSQHLQLNEILQAEIIERLKENSDQMNIVSDMLMICPKKIEFEVLLLVCFILQDCNEIIQHFKKRHLGKELKERSIRLANKIREMPFMKYLFESEKGKENSEPFEILMEKWTITLFLMKVGVFENELETKSIDDCLKSDVISKIDLNDLLNQHLIRPSKKLKKD